jgi:hypothetical protein
MHLPLPGAAAARPRLAAGLAALVLLLSGCATPAPQDQIPGGPAAVVHSASAPASPSSEASTPSAAPTTPPTTPPAAPPAAPPAPNGNATGGSGSGDGGDCSADEYRNVDGICVPRPTQADAPPAGATAECKDGTYSFSKHRSGTCSHHGGVKRWL